MKVSTNLFFNRASTQLATVQSSLSKTQEQLSTGKQITKPSDEPDKASLVTRLESELARQESYQSTLSTVEIKLSTQETALRNVSDVMYRIKELTVQANSDTMGKFDRESIAVEIESLRDQVLSLANTQDTSGNYIFAGSRVTEPSFGLNSQGLIDYQGDQSRMQVPVGDQRSVQLNRSGAEVFARVVRNDAQGTPTGVGFFQVLDDAIAAVKNSDHTGMQQGMAELDDLQTNINLSRAQIGSDQNMVQSQQDIVTDTTLTLKNVLSGIEDLDYASAVAKLNQQTLALQAAQGGFAKVSQLSLFNYIN